MSTPGTVWYTRCPVPTAFAVALGLGWLEDEFAADGLTLRSLASSADPAVRGSHFDQGQRYLVRHGGNVPVLVARSRGADVRVVATSWTDFHEPVLVRPASDIRTVADLRGRRIAVPTRPRAAVDWWRPTVLHGFARALATVGLGLADVVPVEVPVDRPQLTAEAAAAERASLFDPLSLLGQQREEAVALLTGRVDAVFSHASLAANLRGITGARVLVDVGALPDRAARVNNGVPQVLTVTGPLLADHPELVARLLARVAAAADWAASHHEAARALLAQEVGLPDALVDIAYSPRAAGQLAIGLSDESVAGLRAQAAWLDAHGALAAPVDVDALIAAGPLDAAHRLAAATPVGA